MRIDSRYHQTWKALLFWAIFLVMYGAYKFFPVFPLSFICAVNESTFQHFKAGFYAYLITSLIEYLCSRQKITDLAAFGYSRLAAAVFLPWLIFVFWYIAPAIVGRWPNNVYEIVYANIITLIVAFSAVSLESSLEKAPYPQPVRVLLIALLLASVLLYTVFTFRLPWADVFAEPNWR